MGARYVATLFTANPTPATIISTPGVQRLTSRLKPIMVGNSVNAAIITAKPMSPAVPPWKVTTWNMKPLSTLWLAIASVNPARTSPKRIQSARPSGPGSCTGSGATSSSWCGAGRRNTNVAAEATNSTCTAIISTGRACDEVLSTMRPAASDRSAKVSEAQARARPKLSRIPRLIASIPTLLTNGWTIWIEPTRTP